MSIEYSYCNRSGNIPKQLYISTGRCNGKSYMMNMFNEFYDRMYEQSSFVPEIKKVIFNNPATIILWSDGTKTVVKCGETDIYDPEKGLAVAIAKKALGNKGNYYNEFKKWIPEEETVSYNTPFIKFDGKSLSKELKVTFDKAIDAIVKIGNPNILSPDVGIKLLSDEADEK